MPSPSTDAAARPDIVRHLIDTQCPQWAGMPLTALRTSGTEHHAWRLGDDWIVRLPRDDDAAQGLLKELTWLPRLAGRLPLAIPEVEFAGIADEGFAHPWLVSRWIDGEDCAGLVLTDRIASAWADVLADVVIAVHGVDLTSVPRADWPSGGRGGRVRSRIQDVLDNPAVMQSLRPGERPTIERVLGTAADLESAPGPPMLLHADLIPGNLVQRAGILVGLLDFGTLTTGAPAWDLTPAWWILDAAGRAAFRDRLCVDDADWAVGRALALTQGLLARWYYEPRGHALAPLGARAAAQALSPD
ncbi:MAG: phosphotransferase [Phycicoccus sp.]|nr:phosphotransferase [Phycicoccus sp.]